jgi:uncharacterized membrane protein
VEFLAELHPRIVHFPIAFFILYFFFESFGVILKKDFLSKAAFLILIVGVLTALLAVLSGNQAQAAARLLFANGNDLNKLIELHEEYATLTLFYFSAVLFLRIYLVIKKKLDGNWQYLFILLGLIGCYLIYTTGIHGGDLVFKHGIGTQLFGK